MRDIKVITRDVTGFLSLWQESENRLGNLNLNETRVSALKSNLDQMVPPKHARRKVEDPNYRPHHAMIQYIKRIPLVDLKSQQETREGIQRQAKRGSQQYTAVVSEINTPQRRSWRDWLLRKMQN